MLAVISYTFPREAEVALVALGHRTLRMPPHPALPSPVASHPDMLLFFAADAIYCTRSYAQIAKRELLEISAAYDRPICCIEKEYGNAYPHDVPLNAVRIGDNLLCNQKTVAPELWRSGLVPLHVNQGYTKCSVLPIGNRALITADASIAACAKKNGIACLQIQPGDIFLPGYHYGFVGGCASLAPRGDADTIFFCGDFSQHPDAKSIEDFCHSFGYQVCSCGNIPLTDVGTIFMI